MALEDGEIEKLSQRMPAMNSDLIWYYQAAILAVLNRR